VARQDRRPYDRVAASDRIVEDDKDKVKADSRDGAAAIAIGTELKVNLSMIICQLSFEGGRMLTADLHAALHPLRIRQDLTD